MFPKTYLQKFAARVVERSGIALPTVMQVIPAVFDEIRYQLAEGSYPCVPIESFGTFAVNNRPEHEYYYNHKGADRIVTVPAKKQLKFKPTHSFQREIDAGQFDPSRKSFSRHSDDRPIRKRNDLRYRKGRFYKREDGASAKPICKKSDIKASVENRDGQGGIE